MRHLKLIVAYDGTNYHGWQVQRESDGPTVQGTLEAALYRLTGERVRVTAASRTDAGVHAWGQVVNFATESRIPVERFPLAMNSVLPADVVVRRAEEVGEDFHARFQARRKIYRYVIYNSRVPSPFWRRYAWFIPVHLDQELMREGAGRLVGRHDYRSFCASGSPVRTFVRTVDMLNVERRDNLIYITIAADGFLYNMVRIIAGTLVEVGQGKRSPASLAGTLAARRRETAGETAPPQGLCLLRVDYGPLNQGEQENLPGGPALP